MLKEPYMSAKEPYTSSKESHVSTKGFEVCRKMWASPNIISSALPAPPWLTHNTTVMMQHTTLARLMAFLSVRGGMLPNIRKRALCIRKRAPYICKRALCIRKRVRGGVYCPTRRLAGPPLQHILHEAWQRRDRGIYSIGGGAKFVLLKLRY